MRQQKGYSLIELLVVLALIASMLLISLPRLFYILQTYYVKTAASHLAIQIRFARNESVTRKIDYRIVIYSKKASVRPNTYTIEYNPQGDGTSFEPVPGIATTLPLNIMILDSSIFTGGVATISFDSRGSAKATGTPPPNPPFQIDVASINGQRYRVQVEFTGAVQVNKV
jgi:prepilin-type N-terminal cleavage/methylation domain-containing protein